MLASGKGSLQMLVSSTQLNLNDHDLSQFEAIIGNEKENVWQMLANYHLAQAEGLSRRYHHDQ